MGLLGPGDQLPTAKDVVAQLGINLNTVLKAYRELERDGLVAPCWMSPWPTLTRWSAAT
jgi:GntR family transcriptional regulator